ncbi:MAG: signal peptide peptidase SppA [Candidatus Pacebacteria bacterium]|nr:signal peptide peptidase SppA [Candidatus Paceibacterota bacterium]
MEGSNFKEKISLEQGKNILHKSVPFFKWVLIIAIGFGLGNLLTDFLSPNYYEEDTAYEDVSYEGCTVAGINLHGSIVTYVPEHAENDSYFDYDVVGSEDILWAIDNANEDSNIHAIVIEVDSPGGSPVAGEEIAKAIKNSPKPVVAFVRDMGASAAYWAVSSAEKIFASRNSEVGSIGVTMSYLNNVEKNKTEGYQLEQLSSGKFKDAGSTDKALTKEEKELFLRDVNIIYENFMEDISVYRGIPIEKVREFSDGSTVLGARALELGMIDEIGGINEVKNYLKEILEPEPVICW